MNKEGFIKLINNALKYKEEEERWSNFGIPLYELPLSELGWGFFNISIEEIFDIEAVGWINWWLFEKPGFFGGESNQAYNEDGSVIPTDTIDDLWELVKNNQK